MEKIGTTRCALDASKTELFTQKKFADLIFENHSKNLDYYLARIYCKEKDSNMQNIYYCYDAKSLCKYIFEMIVTSEGSKIKIKNFKDPLNQKEIGEITFFKLRHDSDTPMKAEYEGNHMKFLESSIFRNKIFYKEDPLNTLSVNFQITKPKKLPYLRNRRIFDVLMFLSLLFIMSVIIILGFKTKKIGFNKVKPEIKPKA